MTTITLPIRIGSLNKILTHHWAQRYRSNTSHRWEVYAALKQAKATHTLPCTVTLTRIAPRQLDGHDNLQGGFKSVVDAVADWFDIKDNDARITWQYGQRKGASKEYGCSISIESSHEAQ